jgi:hypothetical protein
MDRFDILAAPKHLQLDIVRSPATEQPTFSAYDNREEISAVGLSRLGAVDNGS